MLRSNLPRSQKAASLPRPTATMRPATAVRPLAISPQSSFDRAITAIARISIAPAMRISEAAMTGILAKPTPPILFSNARTPTSWPRPTAIAVMEEASFAGSISDRATTETDSTPTAAAIVKIVLALTCCCMALSESVRAPRDPERFFRLRHRCRRSDHRQEPS
jgi:hypothetical protein